MRSILNLALSLILAAIWGPTACAADPGGRPGTPKPGMGGMGQFAPPGPAPAFMLPGYWALGMENTQKELKLTDQQKQKLKDLAEKYQTEMREYWSQSRRLPREEQQQRSTEWRERSAKQQREIRKQVEAVLQPEQLARLKEMNFHMRGPALLGNPRTMELLGLTEDQKGKLERAREESQQKMQQLQQEMRKLQHDTFHRSVEILTPEQQAKLKEQVETQTW
jgi:Spy/CpxP family protein refolding chaperone